VVETRGIAHPDLVLMALAQGNERPRTALVRPQGISCVLALLLGQEHTVHRSCLGLHLLVPPSGTREERTGQVTALQVQELILPMSTQQGRSIQSIQLRPEDPELITPQLRLAHQAQALTERKERALSESAPQLMGLAHPFEATIQAAPVLVQELTTSDPRAQVPNSPSDVDKSMVLPHLPRQDLVHSEECIPSLATKGSHLRLSRL